MTWTRRRRFIVLGATIACVVAVGLTATSYVGYWGAYAHWSCKYQNMVGEGVAFVPAVLVNSPFGGNVTGKGTIPASFPGSLGYPNLSSYQTSFAVNGTASGTFNSVNVSILQGKSELVLGPGTNSRCSQSFLVVLSQPPYLGTYAGWPLSTPSNLSDRGEVSFFYPPSTGVYKSLPVYFDNSFVGANENDISTCNTSARWVTLPANSNSLAISIGFSLGGQNLAAPLILPFVESFHYWFPANFGTWQVDNLSAPGGPGGGWAFNYVGPCS
jgi:hypothetical protein